MPVKPNIKMAQRPLVSTNQPTKGRETMEAILNKAVAMPMATASPPKYVTKTEMWAITHEN